jgi:uncharacterized protein YbjT (DUF2867 family)
MRPLAVDDLARVVDAAVVEGRLSRATVPVLGPEELTAREALRRVAEVVGRPVAVFPLPVALHYVAAWLFERAMRVPLVSRAQVRILAEGLTEPAGTWEPLPEDLAPRRRFTPAQIAAGLPAPGGFGRADLRCCVG